MKFATSALFMVVLLFAVSQASVLPAAELVGDKISDEVESATAATKSVTSADSQPTEVSTTGVEIETDCSEMYTELIADLGSQKKTALSNMSDCLSQGNSDSVCDDKFGPTLNELNSRISALNHEFQMCMKQAVFHMINI